MKKKILIINGPNLNLLGQREDDIYGKDTLENIKNASETKGKSLDLTIDFFQSNNEGEIINKLHEVEELYIKDRRKLVFHTHTHLSNTKGYFRDAEHLKHFIDELVKENIQFDMMFYPMRKHGIADDEARIHLYTKMLNFWKLNL